MIEEVVHDIVESFSSGPFYQYDEIPDKYLTGIKIVLIDVDQTKQTEYIILKKYISVFLEPKNTEEELLFKDIKESLIGKRAYMFPVIEKERLKKDVLEELKKYPFIK